MPRSHLFTALFISLLLLGGCSSTQDELDEFADMPPEEIYTLAVDDLKVGRYSKSADKFEEVEQKHPFSPWATRAQINLIYSRFKQEEYEESISAAERFLRMHPRHSHAPYAFYMRGLANYRQINDAYRDQEHSKKATAAFREVISRFPNSDYAWEADQMLKLCRDRLVEHEMTIARYYLDREEHIAAHNRFKAVIENRDYTRTPYMAEALLSLVITSFKLGMLEDARQYAAILGHNYPDSIFYVRARGLVESGTPIVMAEFKSYRKEVDEGSLLQRVIEGIAPGLPPGLMDQ